MNIVVNPSLSCRGIGAFCGPVYPVHMRKKPGHFLRQWRESANKTLVQVAEHLHMTHGNLSKIERGLVPYNQDLLEALADLYMCDAADLIIRDPKDPNGIWSVWDNAKPGDKLKIVTIAKAIVGDSTGTS